MQIFRTKDGPVPRIDNAVVTMGNFDGVHKGHQKLLRLTRSEARKRLGRSAVVTFNPHPVTLFKPAAFRHIQPLEEKLARLEKAGIDVCVVVEFTRDMADVEPRAFVSDYLLKWFEMTHIIIGYDTTFGCRRSGTPETMREYGLEMGFETTVVDAVLVDGEPVSSSRIRKAVAAGHIREANDLLGYAFKMNGTVVKGFGRGASVLGFPTANVQIEGDLVPANGVYAAWVNRNGSTYRAALNIGHNPTFGNDAVSIEAFLLDFNENIYGERLSLKIIQRLRDERRFDNIDALKEQMQRDVAEVRNVLR